MSMKNQCSDIILPMNENIECENVNEFNTLNEGIFHFIENKCYFNYQFYGTIKKVQKKKITIKKLDGQKQIITLNSM